MNKKQVFILACLMATLSASAQLLAGFENWNNSSTKIQNGVSATMTLNGWQPMRFAASTDGTFGSLASHVADCTNDTFSDGLALPNGANGYVEFTIKNTTGMAMLLGQFHFDTTQLRSGSAENWVLEVVAGDLTVGTVSQGVLVYNTDTDLTDVDIDLTGLADSVLDADGFVTFRLSYTGGTSGSGQHTYLDHVGVSAPIPPPTFGFIL